MQPRPPAGSGRGDWSELAQACQSEQAGQVARQVGARATPFVRAQPPTDRPASGQQAARERTCNTASPEGAHPPHLPTGPLSAGAGVKRGVGSHLRGGALSARRPAPPSAKALLLYWCTTPVAASRSAGAVPAIARPVVGRSRSRMRPPPSVPVRGVQRLVWNRRLRRSSAMVRPLLRANARNARAFLRPFRTKGLRSNRAHPSIGTGYFAPCRVRSPRYRFEAEVQARLAAPVSTTARQARGRLGRPAAPAGGRHDLPRSFCR